MALPVSYSTEHHDGNKDAGRSVFLVGGNVYSVILDKTGSDVQMWKATDPTSSFSEQDATNAPQRGGSNVTISAALNGTTIGVVTNTRVIGTGDRVAYMEFDTTTDSWVDVNSDSNYYYDVYTSANPGSAHHATLAYRSDGDIIIASNYSDVTSKGQDVYGIGYHRWEDPSPSAWNTGWTTNTDVAQTDTKNQQHWNASLVMGPSDQCFFAYMDQSGADFNIRGLSSGNTLRTERTVSATLDTGNSGAAIIINEGISYDRNGTDKIAFLVLTSTVGGGSATYTRYHFTHFTDDTNPTISSETIATGVYDDSAGVNPEDTSGKAARLIADTDTDGTNYLVFIDDTDQDIYARTDSGGTTWSDVNSGSRIATNTSTADSVTLNLYTRGISVVLAFSYNDNGSNEYYDEYEIRTSGTAVDLAHGSYTLTGYALDIDITEDVDLAHGSYTLSGHALDIDLVRPVDLAHGSYTLSGHALDIDLDRAIDLAAGSYTLSGHALDITVALGTTDVDLAHGSYTLSGYALDIPPFRAIDLAHGSYTLSGYALDIDETDDVDLAHGSYTLSGHDLDLPLTVSVDLGGGSGATFVGATHGGYASNSGATISLTSLIDGSDTQPSDGDLIVWCANNSHQSDRDYAPIPNGFTLIDQIESNDAQKTNGQLAYMVASGTTSLTVSALDRGGVSYIVMVFRGIDTSDILDAAGASKDSALNTGSPPSITHTPTASGVVSVYFGGAGIGSNNETITDPGNLDDFWNETELGPLYHSAVGGGYVLSQTGGKTVNFGISNDNINWASTVLAISFNVESSNAYTLTGYGLETSRSLPADLAHGSYTLTGYALDIDEANDVDLAHGSYTLSGHALDIQPGKQVDLAHGSYTLSGYAIDSTFVRGIDLAHGSYTLSGHDLDVAPDLAIDLAHGSYTLTGHAIQIPVLCYLYDNDWGELLDNDGLQLTDHTCTGDIDLALGSYTLTGHDLDISLPKIVDLAHGSYTLSGYALDIAPYRAIDLALGSYTLSGYALDIDEANDIDLALGSYTLSGHDLDIDLTEDVDLAHGSYALAGYGLDITIDVGIEQVNLAHGSYTLSGYALDIDQTHVLDLAHGSYALSGYDLEVYRDLPVNLAHGSYTLSGYDLDIDESDAILLEHGAYTLTGYALDIDQTHILDLGHGSYTLTGHDMTVVEAETIDLAHGSYTLSGHDINVVVTLNADLVTGSYLLSGHDLDIDIDTAVDLAHGSYALTGHALTVTKDTAVDLGSGAYALSGHDLSFTFTTNIDLATVTYTLTGYTITSWVCIKPGQTPGWSGVAPGQTPGWSMETPNQSSNFSGVNPSQGSGWTEVDPSQGPDWEEIEP